MGRAGDRQMIRTALAAMAILTAITPAPARQREAAAPSLIEVFVAGEGAYHTVRLSYDEGQTWAVSRVINDGPSAYSSLVVLPDRSIGLLFERGDRSPSERITFARFTLEWLTSGSDR